MVKCPECGKEVTPEIRSFKEIENGMRGLFFKCCGTFITDKGGFLPR